MASTSSYNFNQTFDADDDEDSKPFVAGRDATICLIDCNSTMFDVADSDEESDDSCLFIKCLSVIENLLLRRIVSDKKDLFGLVFYNTQNSPDPKGVGIDDNSIAVPEKCAVFIPVQQIEPHAIRYIKNLRQSEDFMNFTNKYGHTEDANISDVLWLCTTLFTNASKVIKSRNLIWFTNQDSPHLTGKDQLQKAFQKAKDIQLLQIDVKFCPMNVAFDGDQFYKELICQIMNLDVENFEFPETLLDKKLLLNRIITRGYKKRALAYLEFEITNGTKFGVGVYTNTAKDKAKLKSTTLSRKDNKEIKKRRYYKYGYHPQTEDGSDDEEAEFHLTENLDPTKAIKCRFIGKEKVKFSTLEAFEIKQVMNPKIKLLAFTSNDFLNECFYYGKSPQFIYPHDGKIKNSSKFFRALWEQMIDDDKVGICVYTMRLKSSPRIVALVPSQQTFQDGELICYDGFQLIFLPFTDDVRDLTKFMSETVDPEDDDENIQRLMRKIITKLRTKYTPLMFDNKLNSRIVTLVENQVYDEELDEETMDSMKYPNVEAQDERIGKYVNAIDELIDGFDEIKVSKRKTKETDENGNREKRSKIAPGDINEELILEKCRQDDIKSITVQMLRDYLSLKNVTGISKMNKGDLVAKIISLSN